MNLNEQRPSFYSLLFDEVDKIVNSLANDSSKSTKYRTAQICDWVYKKQVCEFDKMTNIAKDVREKLNESFDMYLPQVCKKSLSKDRTEKYLLELKDKNYLEIVIIPDRQKTTLCISSQVGCGRKCTFCATAKLGFIRNLTVEEIIGQFVVAKQLAADRKITNLVFMGMGEPLDNYDNVCRAVRLIQDDRLLAFSPRRITLSTCGVVPNIIKLNNEKIKLKLAVSLNSANQLKREKLMPVAGLYPLPLLKKTLLQYRKDNPFRITFEYVMIKDFNTGRDDAKELIGYLGDISSKLNLIPYNGCTKITRYQPPTEEEIERFISYLQPYSFAVTYRKSRGGDIAAACGQLLANYSVTKS